MRELPYFGKQSVQGDRHMVGLEKYAGARLYRDLWTYVEDLAKVAFMTTSLKKCSGIGQKYFLAQHF